MGERIWAATPEAQAELRVKVQELNDFCKSRSIPMAVIVQTEQSAYGIRFQTSYTMNPGTWAHRVMGEIMGKIDEVNNKATDEPEDVGVGRN